MIWGYVLAAAGKKMPAAINADIATHCHALITGSSGTGKSTGLTYFLGKLLQENPSIIVYFLDFKASEDFKFLGGYPHYYSGTECMKGLNEYYEQFNRTKGNHEYKGRKILIFDEYPAFINHLTMLDKRNKTKDANDAMQMIAEILMMGRSLSYGIWIACQRPDATLFQGGVGGVRENFMITATFGRISPEHAKMLYPSEDIPNRAYKPGEGVFQQDGKTPTEFFVPRIKDMYRWKQNIKLILMEHRDI
ncbi:hypothetical protein [Butyrivibrio sp.]|uniref:hypothetical protein n=1 Tax=Butyrivibrio sp. TaxID=28121 RepID=UPI0025C485FF|nr:hypothetical protein [Butyrivibrio sp.]MBQ9305668.1 hypothetical protein [Butyrivibrio sp.]